MGVSGINAGQPTDNSIYDTRLPKESVPLSALSKGSLKLLADSLNPRKYLAAESSYWRDWRGLFDTSLVPKSHYAAIEASGNPTEEVLKRWQADCPDGATVERLEQNLLLIDRLDVLDDCRENFDSDIKAFLRQQQRSKRNPSPTQTAATQPAARATEAVSEDDLLTDGDVVSRSTGQPLQLYDALIIYAENDPADAAFVRELIQELTQKRDLTICHSDNILAGLAFQHTVQCKLLVERCYRLIVVYSPAFLEKNDYQYISDFAQWQGIQTNRRKLIPVMHQDCEFPQWVQSVTCLKWGRQSPMYNFWDKLYSSVKRTTVPPLAMHVQQPQFQLSPADAADIKPVITITEAPERPTHQTGADESISSFDREYPITANIAHFNQNLSKSDQKIYPPMIKGRDTAASSISLSFDDNESQEPKQKQKSVVNKLFRKMFKTKA